MDHHAPANQSLATESKARESLPYLPFSADPGELRKVIVVLEEENANLQHLVCYLLVKNERLREAVLQQHPPTPAPV